MADRITILVGTSSSGSPVFEEVLVEGCGPNRYRLIQSPGLALGIAAGDVFTRLSDGTFDVLQRGGNICIQMYVREDVDLIDKEASAALGRLGARLDGKTAKQLVYTISADAGFGPIEKALQSLRKMFPKMEWYYGNVYDSTDGVTPLNWWKSSK